MVLAEKMRMNEERVTVNERRALGTALPHRVLRAAQREVVGTCVFGSAVLLDAAYGRFLKSMHPVSNGLIKNDFDIKCHFISKVTHPYLNNCAHTIYLK